MIARLGGLRPGRLQCLGSIITSAAATAVIQRLAGAQATGQHTSTVLQVMSSAMNNVQARQMSAVGSSATCIFDLASADQAASAQHSAAVFDIIA